jgi:hypothetical protein
MQHSAEVVVVAAKLKHCLGTLSFAFVLRHVYQEARSVSHLQDRSKLLENKKWVRPKGVLRQSKESWV